MHCPNCKNDRAHRSRRVGVKEHMERLVGFTPYRCHQCGNRFQIFRYAWPGPKVPRTPAEKHIASTRNAYRWKQRRLELWIYGSALVLFVLVLYFLARSPFTGT